MDPSNPPPSITHIQAARRHEISFLRNGHTWRLQWTQGDEELLIETLATMAADPHCPLDQFDQALVTHHLHHTRKVHPSPK